MKKTFIASLLILTLCMQVNAETAVTPTVDKALLLDGKDNNVRTGMDFLNKQWTLELWAKSSPQNRKPLEYLIGGGEYSEYSWADNAPLVLKDGHIHATFARLSDPDTLDGKWHHIALTCDGHTVRIYRDGRETARRDTAYSILPGTIGVGEKDGTFTGLLDEVRIWKTSIPAKELRKWMNRPLEPSHTRFGSLYGYYPLDDFDGETAVNWVGRGFRGYHLRSGRNDYKGTLPLAKAVASDNNRFRPYTGKQRLFNAVVIQSEWDSDQGSRDQQALKLRIAVQGSRKPLLLTELELDLSTTSCLTDIERIHVYYTGQKARGTERTELVAKGGVSPKTFLTLSLKDQPVRLKPGINYVLVTFDVAGNARLGNRLRATVPSFSLNEERHIPETTDDGIYKEVTLNHTQDPHMLKVLQWNIWNGGVHLADSGRNRVTELVKATTADVVLMQEAYGIQQELAQALQYHLKTKSKGDNLALYSRFPLEETVPWREPFKSNPAVITMTGGQKVMLIDLWLRYAYRPEYTCYYQEKNGNPAQWIREDSLYAYTDIKNIVEKDINPYREKDMPVIMGGDFNSCSHLDWTRKASALHYGYGPVAFPASRYLQDAGYTDTFRHLHPDETQRPEGTWAVIYGHSSTSRIDFIYSKGNARPVQSKLVRTTPEIDSVWPSDHAGVITVFRIGTE